MINSQNNERLFFADKVVLVEGISDRLVLESLMDAVAARFNVTAAIEIIDVGGKHNFADYKKVLDGLLTPTFTVADRDYLTVVGSDLVRGLFESDPSKQWEALTGDRKSVDRASMIEHLGAAISSGDLDGLRNFWNYFSVRQKKLKARLDGAEGAQLEADLIHLRDEGIFLLRNGEIEDYLPPGGRDVRSIVELISNRQWVNDLPDAGKRTELGEIVCAVLGIEAEKREILFRELRQGNVTFPIPLERSRKDAGAEKPSAT